MQRTTELTIMEAGVEMEISGYQASPLTGPEAVCTFHELEQRAQKPGQGPSLIEPRD